MQRIVLLVLFALLLTGFAADEDWHPGLQLFGGVQYNAAHITWGGGGKDAGE